MAKKSKQRRAPKKDLPSGKPVSSPASPRTETAARPRWWERPAVPGIALTLLVVVAYLPVWQADKVWDDDLLIHGQPGNSIWQNLLAIWTSAAADICPLTLTTFRLENLCWGEQPVPYHLVTMALHAVAAVLLWRVLRRLPVPGAWLGAALWALHPVMVESVAWISEMKNTQSGVFFLLSILFFLRSGEPAAPDRRAYVLSLVFAALAIASKTSTIVLPGVLILCAWWREGRFSLRQLGRVSPIVAMVAVAALFSVWTQGIRSESWGGYAPRGWPERLVTVGDTIWFYLGKLAWPNPLIVLYPRWTLNPGQATSWLPLVAALIVTGVLFRWRHGWARPWFLAWSCFVVALAPVMGLVQLVYFQWSLVADHFQYLAAMAPMALLGAGLAQSAILVGRPWSAVISAVILLVLGSLSFQRAAIYQNTTTFWNDLLKRPLAAQEVYTQMAALQPHDDKIRVDIGNALLYQGHVAEAVMEFRQALALKPDSAISHYDLGNALSVGGDWAGAETEMRTALHFNPKLSEAHVNLGSILARRGDVDGAILEFRQAVALPQASGEVFYDLAILLLKKDRLDEAINNLQAAARLSPDNPTITGTFARAVAARNGTLKGANP